MVYSTGFKHSWLYRVCKMKTKTVIAVILSVFAAILLLYLLSRLADKGKQTYFQLGDIWDKKTHGTGEIHLELAEIDKLEQAKGPDFARDIMSCSMCEPYNMDFDRNSLLRCFYMPIPVVPKIPLCLDGDGSKTIKGVMASHTPQLQMFVKALSLDPHLGLIDIGREPDVWSITAAGLKRKVITVETNETSLQKLNMAANIGGFKERLRVLKNSIAAERKAVKMEPCGNDSVSCYAAIQLNDLRIVSNGFLNKAFLRVEIRGKAHVVFNPSTMDLFEKVYIKYVAVRFPDLPSLCRSRHRGAQSDHVAHMLGLLITRNFMPYTFTPQGQELNPAKCATWPEDVLWVHGTSPFPSREHDKLKRSKNLKKKDNAPSSQRKRSTN